MLRVIGCITDEHDLRLVLVAGLLCAFASWTAVTLLSRARVSEGRTRSTWVVIAASVFGAGVWATHFVAMLAFRAPFPIGFDVGLTIASIAIAVSVTTIGFSLIFRPNCGILGGAIVGLAISAMHYVGMLALEGPFRIAWDYGYVAASVVLGAIFGMLAVLAGTTIRNIRGRILAAGSFTLGICAMHFTGMSATALVPIPVLSGSDVVFAPGTLAIAIAAVAVLIVALGLVSAQLDRHLQSRRTDEASRLRAYILELETTKRDLKSALEQAFAASEAKSAFLANMSHELRTPLNAIIGFSDLILAAPLGPIGNPRYREYINDIHNSGSHLLKLINNILDLSRLDAGKGDLHDVDISIVHLLSEVHHIAADQAERAKVSLTIDVPSGICNLRADERRTQQIFLNLVSNAIKFTPENGSVVVRARENQDGLVVEVQDTGIGMAAQDIPAALEHFGQLDSRLARKYEGTGLGLPLASRLVALQGGSLKIASEIGVGTAVTVTFPRSRTIELTTAAAA